MGGLSVCLYYLCNYTIMHALKTVAHIFEALIVLVKSARSEPVQKKVMKQTLINTSDKPRVEA